MLAIASLGVVCLWSSPASADEKNPDVIACEGKREGEACQRTVVVKPDDGEAHQRREPGVCRMGECCTLDYSKGSPPESVCAPCLTCQSGPADDPEIRAEAGDAAQSEPPRAGNGDDPPATTPKSRGCNVTGRPGWTWALLPLLLLTAPLRRHPRR
jgi:hypothetical protein